MSPGRRQVWWRHREESKPVYLRQPFHQKARAREKILCGQGVPHYDRTAICLVAADKETGALRWSSGLCGRAAAGPATDRENIIELNHRDRPPRPPLLGCETTGGRWFPAPTEAQLPTQRGGVSPAGVLSRRVPTELRRWVTIYFAVSAGFARYRRARRPTTAGPVRAGRVGRPQKSARGRAEMKVTYSGWLPGVGGSQTTALVTWRGRIRRKCGFRGSAGRRWGAFNLVRDSQGNHPNSHFSWS